jgi:thiamine-phosphate pyrophosphorylase
MTPVAAGGVARPFPRLIVVTDLTRLGAAETVTRFERLASAARSGTVMVQLRDKAHSARERLAFGRELARSCRRTGQLLQVNDRLDLAVLVGADAVHLGEAAVATEEARRVLPGALVTRACHDVARIAGVDADGVVLSPILAARKGRGALGIEALQKARALLDDGGRAGARLVALGGVDAARVAECFASGADAVGVVGAWLSGSVGELVAAAGIAPR